jgi:HAD superfamily hydrolase (TIGR01509 family)
VVFDCDGLLLDTESVWRATQDVVVARHRAQLLPADDDALHGSTIEAAAEIIAARAGATTAAVLADLRSAFADELGAGIRLMPGALEVLAATGARVPLACASNSWLAALEEKLGTAGIRDRFRALQASDTVERPKPAPDMYAAAARELGIDPADCLAFEDSGTGARAARDAGMRLIAIPTPGGGVPVADLVLESLLDPDLGAWITTW